MVDDSNFAVLACPNRSGTSWGSGGQKQSLSTYAHLENLRVTIYTTACRSVRMMEL